MDFTEGRVAKQMLLFASPLFLSNLLQAVYNIVDMIVVSRAEGKAGLSAISVGGDILNLLTFLAMGFSSAGQVIIAQHVGAGRKDRVGRIIGNLTVFLFGFGLVLGSTCFILRDRILDLMNTPGDARSMAFSYVTVCITGILFIYGYNAISAILRGLGDSRHPFMFVATAAILNLILDLIFILVFHWGAFGAALATVIGQGVSFVWGVLFIAGNRTMLGITLKKSDFRFEGDIMKVMMKLGIPMAIKAASVQFSKLFVNSSVNSYGIIASGASGIEHKLNMATNLCSQAVNVAGSSMVGQNIGATRYDRVPKILGTAIVVLSCICGTAAVIVFTFPTKVFGIFTKDPEVLDACLTMIPLTMLLFVGSVCRSPGNILVDGSGNFKLNFVTAILDGMVNRIGFAVLFGSVLGMGWIGYLYGDAIAGFTPGVIGLLFFLSGKWKTRKYIIAEENK